MQSSSARDLLECTVLAASNCVAWCMVGKSSKSSSLPVLRSAVWKIALFYALWYTFLHLYSLFNWGSNYEYKGHLSFGILVLACLGTENFCKPANNTSAGGSDPKWLLTKVPLMIASGLVVVSSAVAFRNIHKYLSAYGWENLYGALVVYAAYDISSIALWSYCCYLFFKLPLSGDNEGLGGGYSYTAPTIDMTEYRPVETSAASD